ncbi:hypothetical protein YC2023_041789 [Brassica napus]
MVRFTTITLLSPASSISSRKILIVVVFERNHSDVTMEEITVHVTNEERMDDSPGAVFDVMGQTEKEENSSGDA